MEKFSLDFMMCPDDSDKTRSIYKACRAKIWDMTNMGNQIKGWHAELTFTSAHREMEKTRGPAQLLYKLRLQMSLLPVSSTNGACLSKPVHYTII